MIDFKHEPMNLSSLPTGPVQVVDNSCCTIPALLLTSRGAAKGHP